MCRGITSDSAIAWPSENRARIENRYPSLYFEWSHVVATLADPGLFLNGDETKATLQLLTTTSMIYLYV